MQGFSLKRLLPLLLKMFFVFFLCLPLASPVLAGAVKSYSKKATFDDIRFELTNAIIDHGLKLQTNGKLSAMLKRTGADVGSTKRVYENAEYFTFCSAKLSRAMMEANPLNGAYCPFVMLIFVTASKPDEVVVGYQTHPTTGNAASKKAFAAIDKLLDEIARKVVE